MKPHPIRSSMQVPVALLATAVLATAGVVVPLSPATAATGSIPRMWDCSLYTKKCVRTNTGVGSSDSCRWVSRYIALGPTPATIGCEAWR